MAYGEVPNDVRIAPVFDAHERFDDELAGVARRARSLLLGVLMLTVPMRRFFGAWALIVPMRRTMLFFGSLGRLRDGIVWRSTSTTRFFDSFAPPCAIATRRTVLMPPSFWRRHAAIDVVLAPICTRRAWRTILRRLRVPLFTLDATYRRLTAIRLLPLIFVHLSISQRIPMPLLRHWSMY